MRRGLILQVKMYYWIGCGRGDSEMLEGATAGWEAGIRRGKLGGVVIVKLFRRRGH